MKNRPVATVTSTITFILSAEFQRAQPSSTLVNDKLSAKKMSRSLYTTVQAEENRRKPRFDPLNPQFIRPDEEDEAEEDAGFVDDVGLSKTGTKRKKVRTDVIYPCL